MKKRIVIRHGAGYVGRELIRLILAHPNLELIRATSRSQDGKEISQVFPELKGMTALEYSSSYEVSDADCVIVAAEHGKSMSVVKDILDSGYDGMIIDMSADFRLRDVNKYEEVYGIEHAASDLLSSFVYGLSEVNRDAIMQTRYIGNPGCFATALSLTLKPLTDLLGKIEPTITAITGSSGSGARPSSVTHFSTRNSNIRSYKILEHRHQAEVDQVLGNDNSIAFVPSSGPWVRGIWGNAQLKVENVNLKEIFHEAYGDCPFVRLHPEQLPEMRWVVDTPFADIGWVTRGEKVVLGFAIDNMLKGAASQAIQNLNLMLELDERTGLIPF